MINKPRFVKGFYRKMYEYHGNAETKLTKNSILIDKYTWLEPSTIEINENYIISKEQMYSFNGEKIKGFFVYVIDNDSDCRLYKKHRGIRK